MSFIEEVGQYQQQIKALKEQIVNPFLSLAESARYLKVSLSTMEKISANRLIPVYKPFGKVYFRKEDLLNYIINGRRRSRFEVEEAALKKMEV